MLLCVDSVDSVERREPSAREACSSGKSYKYISPTTTAAQEEAVSGRLATGPKTKQPGRAQSVVECRPGSSSAVRLRKASDDSGARAKAGSRRKDLLIGAAHLDMPHRGRAGQQQVG